MIVYLLSIGADKLETVRVQGVVFFLGAVVLLGAHLQTVNAALPDPAAMSEGPAREARRALAYMGLEPGMALCVEAYIGEVGGRDGIKLENYTKRSLGESLCYFVLCLYDVFGRVAARLLFGICDCR